MVPKTNASNINLTYTKFECENCNKLYPSIIRKEERTIELFPLERPPTPYIILENLDEKVKNRKTFYMIGKEKIKFGRSSRCEIVASDVSVSRVHANIKYENGRFIIFDDNSKFGTLIKLQKDLQIGTEKIAVQVGRTVIICTIKDK